MTESPDASPTRLRHRTRLLTASAMKNAARAGLFAPFIFQHVMAARLELLGLKDEMNALRARSNAETEAPNPGDMNGTRRYTVEIKDANGDN